VTRREGGGAFFFLLVLGTLQQRGVVKVADDHHTRGWLILSSNPAGTSPVATQLRIARDGQVVRTFTTEQVFWSWGFEAGSRRVAFHTGPSHGERSSHCELHDIVTGKLLDSWDGDLQSAARPRWTGVLDH
jgi:hypothetical protein